MYLKRKSRRIDGNANIMDRHHCPLVVFSGKVKAIADPNCTANLSRAHGVVVSHPLSMREALGSIPSGSTFTRVNVLLLKVVEFP